MLGSYCIAYVFFFQPLEASYLRLQHKMDDEMIGRDMTGRLTCFCVIPEVFVSKCLLKKKNRGSANGVTR